jgi:putative flippase GtrA
MFDRDTARKALRFCLTGGFVFGVDLSMLWLWSRFTPPLVAVSAAYVIAVTVHFCLNKWWVFEQGASPAGAQFVRYVLAVAACWLCTVVIVSLALKFVTPEVFVAKLMAMPPTTALGFGLMKFFVFRQKATLAQERLE